MDEVTKDYSCGDERELHYVCVACKSEKNLHSLGSSAERIPATTFCTHSPAADCDTLYGFRKHTVW